MFLGILKPRKGVTLGQEFAGVVADVGGGVKRFTAGDAVLGQTGVTMSAYAQYLAVKGDAVVVKKTGERIL